MKIQNKKEFIPCNLCGEEDKKELFMTNCGQIVCCPNCGLVYVSPRERRKEILKTYEGKNYFEEGFGQKLGPNLSYQSYKSERPVYLQYFNKKIKEIERYYPRGKILDVGCGLGFFLEVAQNHHWQAEGVEISKYAAFYVSQNLRLKVFEGTLENLSLSSESFDVVTLFQLIEHLNYPLETLLEIYRLLKPRGLVVITAPNQGGILAKIMGRYWFQYKYQGHLYFFSLKTLKLLLKKAGFEEIEVRGDNLVFLPLRFIFSRINYLYRPFFIRSFFPVFNLIFQKSILGKIPIPFYFGYLFAIARKVKIV